MLMAENDSRHDDLLKKIKSGKATPDDLREYQMYDLKGLVIVTTSDSHE